MRTLLFTFTRRRLVQLVAVLVWHSTISFRCPPPPAACRSGSTRPSPGDGVARFAGAGFHFRAVACSSCPSVRGPSFVDPFLTSVPPMKLIWKWLASEALHRSVRTAPHFLRRQIGRASCRERVYISVVS